jgi:CAAX prenyl protease-like protein
MVATAMVTGGFFFKDLDFALPLKVIFTGGALWAYRKQFKDTLWSWNWTAMLFGVIAVIPCLLIGPQSLGVNGHLGSGLRSLSPPLAVTWVLFWLTGVIVTIPLAEELAFRGYLMRRLSSFEFQRVAYEKVTVLSILASSILFGFLHQNWIAAMSSGLIYALIARRGNALSDAICAHATTNLMIALFALTTGNLALWG